MNSPEKAILKALLIYKSFYKYYKYISINKELKELYILFNTIKYLHNKYPESDKTVDDLEAGVFIAYPAMSSSEKLIIGDICDELRSLEVRDDLIQDLLTSLQKRGAARDLALGALNYSEGRTTEDALSELWKPMEAEGRSIVLAESRNFVTSDLKELREHTIDTPGLQWPLHSLATSLGPLRVGDFGFVFARPETGKTTFLAHAATYMAGQATGPVVWFNNEEQGEKVRVRTYQAMLGLTTDQLFSDITKHDADYRLLTKDQLWIWDDATIYARDVESVMDEFQPALVIFDQIDKIRGFNADRPDLVFGRIYQWARELSKNYCPIIGTCQSDGTGEGVRWLTMSHVAEAKTSKQAEADWILGIGKSNEGGTEDVRFFNISKNKLMGSKTTDPELRHGRFDVFIRPQIARYEDILQDETT